MASVRLFVYLSQSLQYLAATLILLSKSFFLLTKRAQNSDIPIETRFLGMPLSNQELSPDLGGDAA